MVNPYSVLALKPDADDKLIKSAYRKLAMKNHPDQNPDDPGAKDRLSEINNAYAIIGDSKKRRQFDQGEIDADGNPKAPAFGSFHSGQTSRNQQASFGGAEDIFKEFFGGGQQRQAQANPFGFGDQHASVASEEPAHKVKVAITLEEISENKPKTVKLEDGSSIQVKIPPSVYDKQRLTLSGKGTRSQVTGKKRDLEIIFRISSHPIFAVQGANLRYNAHVKVYDAHVGCKIKVPTLSGNLNISVAPGTNSGKVLRIPGKGLPKKTGFGDLLVKVMIDLPGPQESEFDILMRKMASNSK